MGEVLQFERNFTITELFLNMNRTQHDFNKSTKDSIFYLKKRYEWLKAGVFALALVVAVGFAACASAIHDFKSKPVTVLLENQVQELDKLPLPPLEELKGE